MSMNKRQLRGFTLIELIIFIVVVGAGLAGILAVSTNVVRSSADPMVRKQAMALADSILEEIVQKEYLDPDGVSGETTRDTMDDVGDYNAIDETLSASGPIFLGMPSNLYGYRIRINVVAPPDAAAKLGTLDAERVTVTVSRGSESIVMTGYRTNY